MKTLKPSDIAQYCDVHQRTVSRWIANGQLKGHKLPGRGNYRVLVEDFINFLHQQKMPMPEAFLASNNKELSAAKKSILIIDDELSMRNALKRALQSTPYTILFAQDGFQAGVKIIAEKPDLILLDLSLPGLDGFEVIQFIRQRQDLATLKILVLSGLSSTELVESIRLGADDAIAKPFDNKDLLNRVNMLLS
ncbi:response regulator [Shewanella decolorationis S12]|uniref:Response regulator n=2 Tax=Shewanella decolorationis TaxID=256839 RepID=A0ABN0PS55_9GAMM|nr:response regulator [Shewanella decolorationis S12]GLR31271.1 transcriptional regulator [Shewanella decolorationis]